MSYRYNDWGLMAATTASTGHKFLREMTTPLWTDAVKLQYGDTEYFRTYEWLNNSLLAKRTIGHGEVADAGGSAITSTITSMSSVSPTSVTSPASGSTITVLAPTTSVTSTSSVTGALSSVTAPTTTSSSSTSTTTTTSTVGTVTNPSVATSTETEHAYSYDALKQLQTIKSTLRTLESYTFNSTGNPTKMKDADGATWTYASAGALNQITKRTSDKGDTETLVFDKAGRVNRWVNKNGTHEFYYNGAGQLQGYTTNGVWQKVFAYDGNGALTRIADNNPHTSAPAFIYVNGAWRYDEKTATVTENDNAFVVNEGGVRRWLFKEFDGHAAMTFDDAGQVLSKRVLGAYGDVISSSGDT